MNIAVIPCYNVEKFCEKIILETVPLIDRLILVDDGSTDQTIEILKKIEAQFPQKISLCRFVSNRGKGAALLEGMKKALQFEFKTLITLDSDGQHLPSDMPKLIALSQEGIDLVIGSRNFKVMPFRSKIGNTLISFLLRCQFKKAPRETQSGYRAFRRELVEEIVKKVTLSGYEMEFKCILLALCRGFSIRECLIQTIYIDSNRSSHFSIFRDSWRVVFVFFQHWRCKNL